MSEEQQRWMSPDGQPFDRQRFLFAPAPEQIGRVVIASSTLPQSQVWRKVLSAVGIPFRHTLGYLGEAGMACFECERDPGRLVRREVLVFSEAATLFRRIHSSSFEFLWKDPLDRLLFRYEDGLPSAPGSDHIFHLLRAGEEAWTHWLLDQAAHTLERGGSVEFPILGQGSWRLRRNAIGFGAMEMRRDDLEFFRKDEMVIELHPSYIGEARGFKPLKAARGSIGNVAVLEKLLVHALGLPLRD